MNRQREVVRLQAVEYESKPIYLEDNVSVYVRNGWPKYKTSPERVQKLSKSYQTGSKQNNLVQMRSQVEEEEDVFLRKVEV